MNLCTSWSFVPSASIGTNMWRGATLERISSVVGRHFFWNWFKINQSIPFRPFKCCDYIWRILYLHPNDLSIAYYIQFHQPIVDLFFVETSHTFKLYANMSITYLFFLLVTELWRNINQLNGLDFHDKILCYDLFEGYLSHVLL